MAKVQEARFQAISTSLLIYKKQAADCQGNMRESQYASFSTWHPRSGAAVGPYACAGRCLSAGLRVLPSATWTI